MRSGKPVSSAGTPGGMVTPTMSLAPTPTTGLAALALGALAAAAFLAPRPQHLPLAFVDGAEWPALSLADFEPVNGDKNTWSEQDGVIRCTGRPIGGAKSRKRYKNFEMVVEWKHHTHGGNSGIFVWCPDEAFTDLEPGQLPRHGIEVQVLDLGYEEQWLAQHKERSDWFTSHGDVFPVGSSTMTATVPTIEYEVEGERFRVGTPTSSRSFPTDRRVRPHGEWNHYYVRAIDGEVRLWVNGDEVTCGTKCAPSEGWLALEAEGALVEFRNLRLRELP